MKQPKSFEEGLTRLQELLTALQDESTPLAQSVKLYAEAAAVRRISGSSTASASPALPRPAANP